MRSLANRSDFQMDQLGHPDPLQRLDAPYALGAFSPTAFIKQILSVLLFRSISGRSSTQGLGVLTFREEIDFWRNQDLLSAATLDGFWITDWFPRVPGLYWSNEAAQARQHIERREPKSDKSLGTYYEPAFKSEL